MTATLVALLLCAALTVLDRWDRRRTDRDLAALDREVGR